jgi:hypothetical protein
MSCHNLGFTPHNPEDLARALGKLPIVCKDCGSDEFADCHDARIVDNIIYYRSLCVRCDKVTGRSIKFYNPKEATA